MELVEILEEAEALRKFCFELNLRLAEHARLHLHLEELVEVLKWTKVLHELLRKFWLELNAMVGF